MLLIDKRLADLVVGYNRIRSVDRGLSELRSRWRQPLLAGYARRRKEFETTLARYRGQEAGLSQRIAIGLIASLALVVAGLAAMAMGLVFGADALFGPVVAGGFVLMGGGVAAGAGTILRQRNKTPALSPPPHPFQADLFAPMLPGWHEKLRGRLPAFFTNEFLRLYRAGNADRWRARLPANFAEWGMIGECLFIARLQQLREAGFIVHRLQQRPGDDVDVLVVGPKGIWVFEVKYWSRDITWRDGAWRHFTRREVSGDDDGEPPDQQWRRMADHICETLERHGGSLLRDHPSLKDIRGGIVFTIPDATYNIPSNAPFQWGLIEEWANRMSAAPPVPDLGERAVLRVLDVLLARHREVIADKAVISMAGYADSLIRNSEQQLTQWAQ
ncbi:MAG: NERD domain-containing protein [Chloroflexi bacterium]|nr:NERD domain-containing protein [Chloroflexota bacterium]